MRIHRKEINSVRHYHYSFTYRKFHDMFRSLNDHQEDITPYKQGMWERRLGIRFSGGLLRARQLSEYQLKNTVPYGFNFSLGNGC
jgi:hypothetical protein